MKKVADIIMIKPAMSYLDMVYRSIKKQPMYRSQRTVSAVNMPWSRLPLKWAGSMKKKYVCEMAASAYRAGVNIYLTYYAKELARFIDEGRIG